MPELPEVAALAELLRARAAGHRLARVEVASIQVVKTFDPPLSDLVGRTVRDALRRGKFLALDADGMFLVLHLARAGWLHWRDAVPPRPARPGRGPLALRVVLDDGAGFDVTEQGTQKRLAAYCVRDLADVPGIARLGPDPLDPAFTAGALAGLLEQAGRAQLKGVLTEQSRLAGIGNAYSDEILHRARLSPFKPAASLTPAEVTALHDAIVTTLTGAFDHARGAGTEELKGEKREGLAVHGRAGLPCPVCGDTVRSVFFADSALQYCPTCQTGGKPLADRRLSRLLR